MSECTTRVKSDQYSCESRSPELNMLRFVALGSGSGPEHGA